MAAKTAWDRLDEESTKAYEAFSVYRDLGTNRSLDAVAQKLKKSATIMGRWSSTYDWVNRAIAYDEYIDAQARIKLDRDAIKRKADMLKRHAGIGKALQSFGLQHVQTTKQPAKAADAISAIKAGVEIERKSEGLPEYLIEVMEASNDDLTRQYNELLAQIGSPGSGNEAQGDAPTGSDSTESQDPQG